MPRTKGVTYVVQVKQGYSVDGVVVHAWRDAAEVAVAARTKMATVRRRAAEAVFESGEAWGEGPWQLRVLDPDNAKGFKVEARQRDPELVVEGA